MFDNTTTKVSNIPQNIAVKCKISGSVDADSGTGKQVFYAYDNRTGELIGSALWNETDHTYEIFLKETDDETVMLTRKDTSGIYFSETYDRLSLCYHTFQHGEEWNPIQIKDNPIYMSTDVPQIIMFPNTISHENLLKIAGEISYTKNHASGKFIINGVETPVPSKIRGSVAFDNDYISYDGANGSKIISGSFTPTMSPDPLGDGSMIAGYPLLTDGKDVRGLYDAMDFDPKKLLYGGYSPKIDNSIARARTAPFVSPVNFDRSLTRTIVFDLSFPVYDVTGSTSFVGINGMFSMYISNTLLFIANTTNMTNWVSSSAYNIPAELLNMGTTQVAIVISATGNDKVIMHGYQRLSIAVQTPLNIPNRNLYLTNHGTDTLHKQVFRNLMIFNKELTLGELYKLRRELPVYKNPINSASASVLSKSSLSLTGGPPNSSIFADYSKNNFGNTANTDSKKFVTTSVAGLFKYSDYLSFSGASYGYAIKMPKLGLIGWYDPNDTSTITIATGISKCTDKSGMGRDLVQATASYQPSRPANAINNKYVFRFDGVGDFFNFSSSFGVEKVSFFHIQKTTDPKYIVYTDTNRWAVIADSADSTSGGSSTDSLIPAYLRVDSSNVDPSMTRATSYAAMHNKTCVVSLLNCNVSLWGTQRINGHPNWYGAYDLGEVIVVSGHMTIEKAQQIEAYLAHGWGTAASLDNSNPYKSSPPVGTIRQIIEEDNYINTSDVDILIRFKSNINSSTGSQCIWKVGDAINGFGLGTSAAGLITLYARNAGVLTSFSFPSEYLTSKPWYTVTIINGIASLYVDDNTLLSSGAHGLTIGQYDGIMTIGASYGGNPITGTNATIYFNGSISDLIFAKKGTMSKKAPYAFEGLSIFQNSTTELPIERIKADTDNNEIYLWTKLQEIDNNNETILSIKLSKPSMSGQTGSLFAQSLWDSNYIGVYHFNNSQTLLDSTGNHINGVFHNIDSSNFVNDDTGYSLSINGVDEYITIPYPTIANSQRASMSIVMEADSIVPGSSIIDLALSDSLDNGPQYTLAINGSSELESSFFDSSENIIGSVSNPINSATKYFISTNYTGKSADGGLTMSIDSIQVDSATTTAKRIADNSATLYIGKDSYSSTYFSGKISELLISNKQRSNDWNKVIDLSIKDQLCTYNISVGSTTSNNGTAWTPANYATGMWYDTFDLSTITVETGKIASLLDKSGNNVTVSNTLDTNRMYYDTVTQAAKNIQEARYLGGATNIPDGTVTSYTIFIVVTPYENQDSIPAQTSSGTTYFSLAAKFNNAVYFGGNTETTSSPVSPIFSISGNAIAMTETRFSLAPTLISRASTSGINNKVCVCFQRTEVGILSSSINFESQVIALTSSVIPLSLTSINLGLSYTNSASSFNGLIHEVIFIPNILSSHEMYYFQGYLARKHSMESFLPSNHPYKNTDPIVKELDPVPNVTIDMTISSSIVSEKQSNIPIMLKLSNSSGISNTDLTPLFNKLKDNQGRFTGENVKDYQFGTDRGGMYDFSHLGLPCSIGPRGEDCGSQFQMWSYQDISKDISRETLCGNLTFVADFYIPEYTRPNELVLFGGATEFQISTLGNSDQIIIRHSGYALTVPHLISHSKWQKLVVSRNVTTKELIVVIDGQPYGPITYTGSPYGESGKITFGGANNIIGIANLRVYNESSSLDDCISMSRGSIDMPTKVISTSLINNNSTVLLGGNLNSIKVSDSLIASAADNYNYINMSPWNNQNEFNTNSANIGAWSDSDGFPIGAESVECFVAKNKVHVTCLNIGNNNYSSAVYSANINEDGSLGSWYISNYTPTAIHSAAIVLLGNKIHIIGGYSGAGNTKLNSIYTSIIAEDGSLGPWNLTGNTPVAKSSDMTAITKNRIYTFGGYADYNPVYTVHTAPIDKYGNIGAWTTAPFSAPQSPQASTCFTIGNNVYMYYTDGYRLYVSTFGDDGILSAPVLYRTMYGLGFSAFQSSKAIITSNRIYIFGQCGSLVGNISAPINEDGTLGTFVTNVHSNPSNLMTSPAVIKNRLYLFCGYNGSYISGRIQYTTFNGGASDYTDKTYIIKETRASKITFNNGNPWQNQPYNISYISDTFSGWQVATSLPLSVGGGGIPVVTNNYIYIIGFDWGGTNTTYGSCRAPINSDGTIGSWTYLPREPNVGKRHGAVAMTKDRIYLIGGTLGTNYKTNTVITAPITNGLIGSWKYVDNIPTVLMAMGYAVIKNRIYLFGGNNGTDQSAIYSSVIDNNGIIGAWGQSGSLPIADKVKAFVTKTRVYILRQNSTFNVYYAPINSDGTLGAWVVDINTVPSLITYNSSIIVTSSRVYVHFPTNTSIMTAPIDGNGVVGAWETKLNAVTNPSLSSTLAIVKDKIYNIGVGSYDANPAVYMAPFSGGSNNYMDKTYTVEYIDSNDLRSGVWYSLSFDGGQTYKIYISGTGWTPIVTTDPTIHGFTGDTSAYYWDDDTLEWVFANSSIEGAISLAMNFPKNKMTSVTLNSISNYTGEFNSSTGTFILSVSMYSDGITKPYVSKVSINNKGIWLSDSYPLSNYATTVTSSSIKYQISLPDNLKNYYSGTKIYCMVTGDTGWTECVGGTIPNIPTGLVTAGKSAIFKVEWDLLTWSKLEDVAIELNIK